jgi:hypothetical protein
MGSTPEDTRRASGRALSFRATVSRRTLIVVLGLVGAVAAFVAVGIARGAHHQMYRAVLYAAVAKRVTAGAQTQREALQRIHEFVYLNVRSPNGMRKIDDSAADTLIRGFGFCDPSALAFTRLAQEVGVKARMLFLWDDRGLSPHTVAEAYLDGEWRIYDTLYLFAPVGPDGKGATARDLAEHPETLGVSRNAADWFARARPVAEAAPDRVDEILEGLVHEVVFRAPDVLVHALQDVYLRLPPRTYDAQNYFSAPDAADTRLYLRARHLHVFGRAADADAAYRDLLARFPDSDYVDDARYNRALLLLSERAEPVTAVAELETLRAQRPDSLWFGESTYLLARAEEAAGACSSAAALYGEVSRGKTNGQEDARRRLATLACA